MAVNRRIAEALERLTFEHREEGYRHHTYNEDLRQYEYVKRGDMEAVEMAEAMFQGPTTGRLSDDPLKNYQYLFVASITLACRFCIEGGMTEEEAFNLSDLYIRQVDQCRAVEDVFDLHAAMIGDFTTRMRNMPRQEVYSLPVRRCMDYIDRHLQEPLKVRTLAEALQLSETYLSTLFKRETGVAVSEYIRRKRVDAAQTLLRYTEFSCVEIAEYFCFSSDSHFSRVFREYTGETPTEFRRRNYRRHWTEAPGE